MSEYLNSGDWADEDDPNNYGFNKRNLPTIAEGGKHIPNKNEAALLRKLKASTGLSEDEIRSHKKYRIQLSGAQKTGTIQKRSPKQKEMDRIMKTVTRELKLPKEHPAVVELFKKKWKEYTDMWPGFKY